MKLSKLAKTLPIVLGLGVCANANAGVSATAYLELNDFSVEIDSNKDGVADTAPLSVISVLSATRSGNTSANFNGVTTGDTANDPTGFGTADAALQCNGPSCGALALTNNGQSRDLGNLVHSTTEDFAAGDMLVTGNALGDGASGFTYGDVGISVPTATAAASGVIFNNLLTTLNIAVLSDINLRFTAFYDLLVDSIITPDITANPGIGAIASATAAFSINLSTQGGGSSINGLTDAVETGFSFTDQPFDIPGFGNVRIFDLDDEAYASDWFTLTAGSYQVEVTQNSNAQASLIPEPGAIALFGMGLLGLGLSARRRLTK